MNNETGDDVATAELPEISSPTDAIDRVEGYRTDGGFVLYDARNPLAWIKSTVSTSIERHR